MDMTMTDIRENIDVDIRPLVLLMREFDRHKEVMDILNTGANMHYHHGQQTHNEKKF
jgi:hypothetical protein